MAHRANFIVIRNGQANVYYDRQAALDQPKAFADGPGPAEALLKVYRPTEELYDWAHGEAGYLLDFDLRLAITYGFPVHIRGISDRPDPTLTEFRDPDDVEWVEAGDDATSLQPIPNIPGEESRRVRTYQAYFAIIAKKWAGWTLCYDGRGNDAFALHLASRGITSIRCESYSHPKRFEQVVLVVPAA